MGKKATITKQVSPLDYQLTDEGGVVKNFWNKYFKLIQRFEIGEQIELIEDNTCGYNKGEKAIVLAFGGDSAVGQLVVRFENSERTLELWGFRFKKIDQQISAVRKCNCDIMVIMNTGCQCGGK